MCVLYEPMSSGYAIPKRTGPEHSRKHATRLLHQKTFVLMTKNDGRNEVKPKLTQWTFELSRWQVSDTELSFNSSVRVSPAPHCYYKPQICLNRAVKHSKLCCILLSEKMLKQEGAKLASVLQASVLHLTLATILTSAGVSVIFSCKAKNQEQPNLYCPEI